MYKTVATNERGERVGEDHQNAKLTNGEVELIRQLHAQGMSYVMLAKKFEVSKYHIGRICRYQIRATPAAAFRRVLV